MVDVEDKNEWRECIDIGGVRLPTGYFFGSSAATGDLSGGCEETWGRLGGKHQQMLSSQSACFW